MTEKRKAISKKTRFEVFKRDGFKCQYCGKCGIEIDDLRAVTLSARNWTSWRQEIIDLMAA